MGINSNKIYYPERSNKQLTAPAEYPVTLAEQKAYSRIDGTDEDSLITSLIKAITIQCEKYIRGGIITRTYRQIEDAGNIATTRAGISNPFRLIEIKNIMVASVEGLTFYDEDDTATVISNTKYRVDRVGYNTTGRIVFNDDFSLGLSIRPFTAYQVDYTAGYASASSVPDDIKLAIMASVQSAYENRENYNSLTALTKNILNPYRVIEI